jgi:ribosomal protein S18 acetylase RimI-like enzyme
MIHILQATEKDVPALCGILRRSFKDVADRFGLTPQNCPTHPSNCEESWIAGDMHKGIVYFVLQRDSEPFGCVAMDLRDPAACTLERLAVLPECRGNGLGKSLVDHVLHEASHRGRQRITLAIIAQHSELKGWYESLGFVETVTRTIPQLPFSVTFMERVV